MANKDELDSAIIYDRDFKYNYFGLQWKVIRLKVFMIHSRKGLSYLMVFYDKKIYETES